MSELKEWFVSDGYAHETKEWAESFNKPNEMLIYHVIEKSAYDQVCKERDELRSKFNLEDSKRDEYWMELRHLGLSTEVLNDSRESLIGTAIYYRRRERDLLEQVLELKAKLDAPAKWVRSEELEKWKAWAEEARGRLVALGTYACQLDKELLAKFPGGKDGN